MERTVKYLQACERLLPAPYTGQDLNHLLLVNFVVSGLEVLGHGVKNRTGWVMRHYQGPGFRGSLGAVVKRRRYDPVHLPATYFGIMTLITLDGDVQLNADAVMGELKALQQDDGSFVAIRGDCERDVRFVYMASAIRYILKGKTEVDFDVDAAKRYLERCRNYDGGYGQCPGAESHAGLTYCAVAAQFLLGVVIVDEELVEWLVNRQNPDGGFNGRVGKESDVCYCFWVISTLAILGRTDLIDQVAVRSWLASCETAIGGFGKTAGQFPDLYHSYLGLSVGFILDNPRPLACALSTSIRALERFESTRDQGRRD